ncbi:MAG: SDR family NAD(P)-dependent oxidoreductase [Bacillota bacterium]
MGLLDNKVALITGGSRGIGGAIATRFAQEGADLILNARTKEALENTGNTLREMGRKVLTFPVDVTNQEAVRDMVNKALAEFGRIDILVSNAGIYNVSRFIDLTFEDFDRVMKINLYGTFFTIQAVLASMIQRKKGKIINIASTAGKWGTANQSAYNASKHAVIGLTRCLALEMAPFNINVNAICPGFVETEMAFSVFSDHGKILGLSVNEVCEVFRRRVPMGRLLHPEDIVGLSVFLASEDSNGMTGQAISICGGLVMV